MSRYASLRASEVNLRVGPGEQYPIAWVYHRPGLPLEITAEFDVWRHVRDWQGEEGWVHSNMLSTQRTVIVIDGVQSLRKKPSDASAVVATAETGVVARLLRCPKGTPWCQIEVDGMRGWAPRVHIWGIQKGETVD
ncbi:MAG: SH3 domain-containing protein [Rhodospirillales bacterium]|nr:SH3 domain-containing protein [Rhodospirillales bacterium]